MKKVIKHTFTEHPIPHRCPIRLAKEELTLGSSVDAPVFNDGSIKIRAFFTDGFDEMYARHPKRVKAEAKAVVTQIMQAVSNYSPETRRSGPKSDAALEAATKIYQAIEVLKSAGLLGYTKSLEREAGFLEHQSFHFDPKSARHKGRPAQYLLSVSLMDAARHEKLGISAATSDRSKLGRLYKLCCQNLDLPIGQNPGYQLRQAKRLCDEADENHAQYCGQYSEIDQALEQFTTDGTLPDYIPARLQKICFAGCRWLHDMARSASCNDEAKLLNGQRDLVEGHLIRWMFDEDTQWLMSRK